MAQQVSSLAEIQSSVSSVSLCSPGWPRTHPNQFYLWPSSMTIFSPNSVCPWWFLSNLLPKLWLLAISSPNSKSVHLLDILSILRSTCPTANLVLCRPCNCRNRRPPAQHYPAERALTTSPGKLRPPAGSGCTTSISALGSRGRWTSELEASLVYRVSFRISRAIETLPQKTTERNQSELTLMTPGRWRQEDQVLRTSLGCTVNSRPAWAKDPFSKHGIKIKN